MFIYFNCACSSLLCCRLSVVVARGGGYRLLIAVASLVVEHRLYRAGSIALEQGLNCPKK